MRRVNLTDPELAYDDTDPPGFRAGSLKLHGPLGARRTATVLYELAPGQAVCPYHFEYGEEEWVLVLDGRPIIRTPEGEQVAEPLDLVFFPTGPEGAHQIRNDGDATVRVLMWSNVTNPAVSAYVDSAKVGVFAGDPELDLMVRRSSAVDYYDGETGSET